MTQILNESNRSLNESNHISFRMESIESQWGGCHSLSSWVNQSQSPRMTQISFESLSESISWLSHLYLSRWVINWVPLLSLIELYLDHPDPKWLIESDRLRPFHRLSTHLSLLSDESISYSSISEYLSLISDWLHLWLNHHSSDGSLIWEPQLTQISHW